jgi:type I restriction enzyme S subunit
MNAQPYPNYKNGGVAWLGDVPSHWTVIPIRLVARLESGHTPSRLHPEYWENCVVPWFTLADVWQIREGNVEYVFETKEKISDLGLANSSARLLPKNTVILSRTASVGFSAIMGVDMATTQDFANWICGQRLQPEFLLYVLRSMEGEFRRLMMGSTHNTIYMPDIQSLRFVLPPRSEQAVIVEYVRLRIKEIDALMAEQQHLIDLLHEKRQAVISNAVTKGLNPHAPVLDSGIECLGDVPKHWDTGPLKWYWNVIDCKHVTAEFVNDGIPLASIKEVQGRWVSLENANCTTEYFYNLLIEGGRLPIPGDLIFSRNATVGEVAQVRAGHPRFAMGQDVVLLRKNSEKYSSDFLQFVIRSSVIIHQLANVMIGSTFKRINVEDIRAFAVPSPPSNEQIEIARFLEHETTSIDSLLCEAQRAIDLLQERRSALISAAVTGKIDVRKYSERKTA